MGLTLQFAIGDKHALIDATQHLDLELLYELASEDKLADFSLHLEPDDLNVLVAVAAEVVKVGVRSLREYLDTTTFYFDSAEGGAYFVDQIITRLFATFDEHDAAMLTNKWYKRLSVKYEEEIAVNDDAIEAVRKLIVISKEAQNQNLDLVHIWFL